MNPKPPQPKVRVVTLKIDGFVEELLVSTTGQAVEAGEALLSISSATSMAASIASSSATPLPRFEAMDFTAFRVGGAFKRIEVPSWSGCAVLSTRTGMRFSTAGNIVAG